jgi:hypothetical protein
MNSFEYDFTEAILDDQRFVNENLKEIELAFKDDNFSLGMYLYSSSMLSILDNILRRVQGNNINDFLDVVVDCNFLFDLFEEVVEKNLVSFISLLAFNRLSNERVASLLFVLSFCVDRDSYIKFISCSKFDNLNFLSFLKLLYKGSVCPLSVDNREYDKLLQLNSGAAKEVIPDFLRSWPLYLKKDKVSFCSYRSNGRNNKGAWDGDDCYIVMLLSFLFSVDKDLDPNEEYLPTNLMPLFKERFPLYGVLSNASLRESAVTVPPAVKNTDIHPYAETILNEEEAFIVSAIYAYSTVEYVTEVLKHLEASEDLMNFVSMLNCSECEVDGFTSDEIYFSIEVDHKDAESAIEFLNRAASYIYGSRFEFDLLACDTVYETIQTFNRALEPLGGMVYSLDTGCDNYLFFITDTANKAQLDHIFEEVYGAV